MTAGKLRVLAGPHRLARRYAERKGWAEDSYIIVTRSHQLARLDPALMVSIVMVKLNALGERVAAEIREELSVIRALWTIPMQVEA